MNHVELYNRIYKFSLDVEAFVAPLYDRKVTADIADQLARAARGSAANYRAVSHGRTGPDFRSKLAIALEEADEARHWLRHLVDSGLASGPTVNGLLREAQEISAILGASVRTANRNARARGEARSRSRRSKSSPGHGAA